jgi:hypothetical protein
VSWKLPTPTHLALFYARAKQTFFTPNSAYELDLPSHILAPFHAPDAPQYPNPAMFNETLVEVTARLEKCLERFLAAQMTNVGSNRVLCGIIAGVTFTLIGTVPPLAVNLVTGASRWARLAALPGLWIGLSILFSALNGICLGVYVFGDLRQLHKFELARPPISKPSHLRKERLSISSPISQQATKFTPAAEFIPPAPPATTTNNTRPDPPPRLIIEPPSPLTNAPPPVHHRIPSYSSLNSYSSVSSAASFSSINSSSYPSHGMNGGANGSDIHIEISAAIFDTAPVDGPATSPLTPSPNGYHSGYAREREIEIDAKDVYWTESAGFIHAYDDSVSHLDLRLPYAYSSNRRGDEENPKMGPEERQPLSTFDFDLLPAAMVDEKKLRKRMWSRDREVHEPSKEKVATSERQKRELVEIQTEAPKMNVFSFTSLAERFQHRCSFRKWFVVDADIAERIISSPGASSASPKAPIPSPQNEFVALARSPSHTPSSPTSSSFSHLTQTAYQIRLIRPQNRSAIHNSQLKRIQAVPAFSALTRISSPHIVRAHWEIVVRCAGIAMLVSWVIVGSLLAIPIKR